MLHIRIIPQRHRVREKTQRKAKKNLGVLSALVTLLCLFSCSLLKAYSLQDQLDINRASFVQIQQLPISQQASEKVYEYVLFYGGLKSIYDLRKINEISAEKFEEIKPMIKVVAPESLGVQFLSFYRVQRALAVEEGPTKAAVEDWQDMLLSPMNVNKATVDDLILLQNVSLTDAIAVIKHLKMGQDIKETRDLRDVNGLLNYGYLNMRDFVSYTDPKPVKFSGNYRLNFEYGYDYEETSDPEVLLASINQAYVALEDKRSYYATGISDADIDKYYTRMYKEYDYLTGLSHRTNFSQRVRFRTGANFSGGLRWQKDFNPGGLDNQLQGYLQTANVAPFKKLFLGDYRVIIGQGLLLDNSSEFIARTYSRSQGIFGDLTSNSLLGFRGVGGELSQGKLRALGFYSKQSRDGIENPDGTINYYIISEPRLPTNRNNFTETNLGGSAKLDLSDVLFIPEGSYLAFNTLLCRYNKDFSPLTKWIDIPGDATVFDDANILQLARGNKRDLYSFDFRTALENASLEGEYAWQKDGGKAYLLKGRVEYEYLYLLGILRHYDVNYDNLYNRAFCEQLKFEDTPLEKTYRVIDPTFSLLQTFPSPKAEEGLYLETRYQISRQITFTRVYLDIWRNVAYNLANYRFQGEVEYRPIFPLRFRVRQKIQQKHLPKDVQATVSQTYETSFRVLASLTDRNFLSCEFRRGVVGLTPTMEYGSEKVLWGDFLGVSWEHNFSDAIGLESGIAVWKCDGLSQWIFEDIGIDFLDGRGMKYYFVMTQRPAKFLLLRFKFKGKYTEIPHSGILQAQGLHFANGAPITTRDFVTHNDIFNVGLQLDILW